MIALNREIININTFLFNSAISYSMEISTVFEDVNMDMLRDRSIALSPNLSRESSTHSDLSSQLYVDKVEV